MTHHEQMTWMIRSAPLLLLGAVYLRMLLQSVTDSLREERGLRDTMILCGISAGMLVLVSLYEWLVW